MNFDLKINIEFTVNIYLVYLEAHSYNHEPSFIQKANFGNPQIKGP